MGTHTTSTDDGTETELLLAVQGKGLVICRKCGHQVDLGKSCELHRARDGRLSVVACNRCLRNPDLESFEAFMRRLVDQVGADIVLAALSDLPFVPEHGSRWIWRSRNTADVRSLEFDRVYGDGRTLRFLNADGTCWTCTARDWCTYVQSGQAERRP